MRKTTARRPSGDAPSQARREKMLARSTKSRTLRSPMRLVPAASPLPVPEASWNAVLEEWGRAAREAFKTAVAWADAAAAQTDPVIARSYAQTAQAWVVSAQAWAQARKILHDSLDAEA